MSFNENLQQAQQLCSKQEKCKSEIVQKLKTWESDKSEIEQVIETLVNEGFINEQQFANAFANDKLKFNHWGRIKIEYELKHKQLPESIIDKSLSKLNIEEYNNILESELRKKYKELSKKEIDKYQLTNKLARFAISKGFESELVFKQINIILSE